MSRVDRTAKIGAATIVAIVGVIVGGRAIMRSSSSAPAPRPEQRNAQPPESVQSTLDTGLLPEEEYEFDTFPTEETVEEVAVATAQRMREAVDELQGPYALDGRRSELLAQAIERQMRILLTGDYDLWRARALEFGPPPEETIYSSLEPDTFREMWERSASKARLAPIALKHLRVRPRFLRGEKIEYEKPRQWFGVMFRGDYPKPDPRSTMLDVYEVYFPLHYRSAEASAPDTPVHLGVSFAWDAGKQRWAPHEMVGYSNGFSGPMMSPIF